MKFHIILDIQKISIPWSFHFPGSVLIFSFDKEITAILDIAFTITIASGNIYGLKDVFNFLVSTCNILSLEISKCSFNWFPSCEAKKVVWPECQSTASWSEERLYYDTNSRTDCWIWTAVKNMNKKKADFVAEVIGGVNPKLPQSHNSINNNRGMWQ